MFASGKGSRLQSVVSQEVRVVSMIRCLALVLLLAAPSVEAAKPPKPPSFESLIDHAKAAVRDGTVDPARDLAPLLERLRTSTVEMEQSFLLSAIEDLGR